MNLKAVQLGYFNVEVIGGVWQCLAEFLFLSSFAVSLFLQSIGKILLLVIFSQSFWK